MRGQGSANNFEFCAPPTFALIEQNPDDSLLRSLRKEKCVWPFDTEPNPADKSTALIKPEQVEENIGTKQPQPPNSELTTMLNSERNPNTATPEPDNYSASPIDTIRSMVSPRLTYMRSTEPFKDGSNVEAAFDSNSVILSCLN